MSAKTFAIIDMPIKPALTGDAFDDSSALGCWLSTAHRLTFRACAKAHAPLLPEQMDAIKAVEAEHGALAAKVDALREAAMREHMQMMRDCD